MKRNPGGAGGKNLAVLYPGFGSFLHVTDRRIASPKPIAARLAFLAVTQKGEVDD
jgi:hypothetical protein